VFFGINKRTICLHGVGVKRVIGWLLSLAQLMVIALTSNCSLGHFLASCILYLDAPCNYLPWQDMSSKRRGKQLIDNGLAFVKDNRQ